ncbi:MAG: hypothetical protein V1831_03170 [Candidatus Woesearchaeota archaeon]
MKQVELFVKLLIPDNVAITALHALERMGYKSLKKIERMDYYKFEVEKDDAKFAEEIKKVDILVNANKHKAFNKLEDEKHDFFKVNVLVQSIEDDCQDLLSTLRDRLHFKNIRKMEQGVFWTLYLDVKSQREANKLAEKITKDLLMNEHYQKYRIY